MIKEKDLREMRPQVRFKNGQGITLQTVQDALDDAANESGIPVAFRNDEVKYGGFIGGSTEPCIVLYHPDHPTDYFNVCIRVKHQGTYAFVTVNDFGESRLMGNQGSHDYLMETLKHGSNSERVGALIGSGVRRLIKGGRNNQKLEEEQNWYSMVGDIFDEIVS